MSYTPAWTKPRARGISIAELLGEWQAYDQAAAPREALARVATLGEELSARYGLMPDSTDLIHDDRAR
jgi:hypothetical protein